MFIKIYLKNNLYKNINEIYLSPNLDIPCYHNSHLNYIYKETKDNIEYTFNGFFKDDFFMIICDMYHKNIDINICHKNIMIIKLEWVLKKIDENKSIWVLVEPLNLNVDCFILPIRNNLFKIKSLNIQEYLDICNYDVYKINIKTCKQKYSLFDNIIKILL